MTRVLVFGINGLIASRLTELPTACAFVAPQQRVDVTDGRAVARCLENERPDVVLNAAAFTDVTQAWRDAGREDGLCYRVNALGAENVARACYEAGVRLLHISTGYVFSGEKDSAYSEASPPDATDWYGHTKRVGEAAVLEAASDAAVVRTESPFRARHTRTDVARSILSNLTAGRTVTRFDDIIGMPTFIDDFCAAIDHLACRNDSGIFHATGQEALSPYAFALLLCREWGYPEDLVVASSHAAYANAGNRPYPSHLALVSSRLEQSGFTMPTVRDAVERMHASQDLNLG